MIFKRTNHIKIPFAGPPGLEPGKAVLETAVIPFHYSPMHPIIHFFLLYRNRNTAYIANEKWDK
jgi:hypothetical protein